MDNFPGLGGFVRPGVDVAHVLAIPQLGQVGTVLGQLKRGGAVNKETLAYIHERVAELVAATEAVGAAIEWLEGSEAKAASVVPVAPSESPAEHHAPRFRRSRA